MIVSPLFLLRTHPDQLSQRAQHLPSTSNPSVSQQFSDDYKSIGSIHWVCPLPVVIHTFGKRLKRDTFQSSNLNFKVSILA